MHASGKFALGLKLIAWESIQPSNVQEPSSTFAMWR